MNAPFDNSEAARWLILPVEVKVRELHAKLLLASFAAKAGWNVVFGNAHALIDMPERLPRGVLLDKSISKKRAETFERFKAAGHRVAAWCEEGLVFLSPEEYMNRRVGERAIELADAIFAWGEDQAKVLREGIPAIARKLFVDGNPRADLLRPEYRKIFQPEVEALRARIGPFVLVNTNFGFSNYIHGQKRLFAAFVRDGKLAGPNTADFYKRWIEHKSAMLYAFVAMIREIAPKLDGKTIVVRPHPGETPETWRHLLRGLPDVRVEQEGNFIPWALAADALIHNNCTTAVEAFLMGRPVISFEPFRSEEFECHLPTRVSRVVSTPAEMLGALRMPTPENASVTEYVASNQGRTCSEAILEHLAGLNPGPARYQAEPHHVRVARSALRAAVEVRKAAGRFARSLAGSPEGVRRKAELANRLRLEELHELSTRIAGLGQGLPQLDISEVEPEIFLIGKASAPPRVESSM